VDITVEGLQTPFPAIFIRAPRIEQVGNGVTVLATHDAHPVMVRGDRLMATVFHPELSPDDRVHAYFMNQIVG
jgi:pyridoxal 5'-phosphate synthase pdxT subunit